MKAVYILSTFLCLSLFFSSCQQNPNGGVPIYVRMDSVIVSYQNKTLNAQGITDMWVEANSDNMGAYELPANFPVLQENQVRFTISAGVWESGQSLTRDIYPFYDVDTFTINNAVRGNKYAHHPKFTYKNGVAFSLNEDFEFNKDFDTVMHYALTDSFTSYYGVKYGQITTSAADTDRISVQSQHAFLLPAGQEIWLEMDYKCDIPFWVGIIGNFNGGAPIATHVLLLLPKAYWNKEYVKLSNIVGNLHADTYQLYFEAQTPTGGNPGSVSLDNIKVVHQ